MLTVSDIDVFYGDAQALDGVSIDVEEGRIVAVVGANGDVLVPENRLRAAIELAASAKAAGRGANARLGPLRELHGPRHPALGGSLEDEIARLIGEPWDAELEPFRRAGAGAPVRWLNATG